MQPILLHVCCGPCLTHCAESLRAQAYEPVLFFSNSNIMPREEYDRRRDAARRYAASVGLAFVEDGYDHPAWLRVVADLDDEPEGGRRCEACFRHNLRRAAEYACEHHLPVWTSTLTVSPHKRSQVVFEAGEAAAEAAANRLHAIPPPRFLRVDFKKKNGFLNSLQLAQAAGLYRQTYCGCEFSQR